MTYLDKKERLTNNIKKMDIVDNHNIEMDDKVISKNMYSTIS